MRYIYDATINGERFVLIARNMKHAHECLKREVKKRLADSNQPVSVSIVRRGSDYPAHTETIEVG